MEEVMWVMMMRPSKALSVARDETRERLHSKDDDDDVGSFIVSNFNFDRR